MKKLVTAICALATAAAIAQVESKNVVGFNNELTTVQGCNFFAAPFVGIGETTTDIQQIQLSDGGQSTIGYGEENFSMWEGAPDVVYGTDFAFYDDYMGGYYWEAGDGTQEFSIEPGRGFVIDCAEGLIVKFAGEVSDKAATATTAQGCNFYGNPFGAPIDIQAIQLSDGGQSTIGYGEENFSMWEGAPDVIYGTDFAFYDDYMGGYYWEAGDGTQEFSILPGQGFVIDCAEGLDLTIASPYSL